MATEEPLPDAIRRRVCCVLPCYNVGHLCAPVIRDVARHVGKMIAVDDGSTDETPRFLQEAQKQFQDQLLILTLPRNRGKGVALMRGFRQALRQGECDTFVTVDGDGQHRPGDIPRVARPCLSGEAEFVIAQRQFPPNVPARSRIGNNLSAAILSAAYRHTPRDTQCGLRAHSRGLIEWVVQNVEGNRYETESQILMLALRFNRRIAQVPIPAIYLGKNESSHFRPLVDSLRILWSFFATVGLPSLGVPAGFFNRHDVNAGDFET